VDVEEAQRWNSRGHFFAAAAEAMRRILIDNARRKKAEKRGGRRQRLNTARGGAGGLAQTDSYATSRPSVGGSGSGGGLYVAGGTLDLNSGTTVESNRALGGHGGDLVFYGGGVIHRLRSELAGASG
jgi:hypothetical protein